MSIEHGVCSKVIYHANAGDANNSECAGGNGFALRAAHAASGVANSMVALDIKRK
jgi:hypothetical protein